MSIDTLLTLVELYKEATQLIEAAQTEQETLKAQIKEALAERATNYLEVGCHKFVCLTFPVRDWTANLSRLWPRTSTLSTAKPSQASV